MNFLNLQSEFKNISDTLNVDIQIYNFLKEVFGEESFAPLESAKGKIYVGTTKYKFVVAVGTDNTAAINVAKGQSKKLTHIEVHELFIYQEYQIPTDTNQCKYPPFI